MNLPQKISYWRSQVMGRPVPMVYPDSPAELPGMRAKGRYEFLLKDLPENPKWKPLNDPETMLVHVVLPKAEESAAATVTEAAPAAAEPEVIKKGKTEEKEEKK